MTDFLFLGKSAELVRNHMTWGSYHLKSTGGVYKELNLFCLPDLAWPSAFIF